MMTEADNVASGLALDRRQGRFVIIGRAGMDLYPQPAGERTELARSFVADMGGSAGNIAVGLARRGHRVGLCSCVNNDPVGDYVVARLKDYRVDTDLVRCITGLSRTSLALAETRPDDARVVIYRNDAADLQVSATQVEVMDYADMRALVVTGTALSREPSRSACMRAGVLAQAAGVPVIFDVDYRAEAWASLTEASSVCAEYATRVDLLVGNDLELAMLAGDLCDIQAGRALAAQFAQSAMVLYKQGRQGCTVLHGGQEIWLGVYKVSLAKPFGAGDAFLANALARLCEDDNLLAAVDQGAAAAAWVISRPGCASAMPDTAKLKAFCRHRSRTQ